jgi:hypothetical protein
MLVIVGMILLLTWIFEHAFHLTADSLVNLLLIFASISFALDFIREQEITVPRPGWDDRPRRLRAGSVPPRPCLRRQRNRPRTAKAAYNAAASLQRPRYFLILNSAAIPWRSTSCSWFGRKWSNPGAPSALSTST